MVSPFQAVVIDDPLRVVGSMNLDLRSQLQNSEVAIAVRNRNGFQRQGLCFRSFQVFSASGPRKTCVSSYYFYSKKYPVSRRRTGLPGTLTAT